MSKNTQMPIGDLSGVETDLPVPSSEAVTKRAHEIALINERNPDEFTDADWEQARRELTGNASAIPDDAPEETASLSERDDFPGESGKRAPRATPEDEILLGEQLVSRGVDEAAHDQMVEAGQEDQTQEG